jgi:hypothetical protein
VLRFVARLRVRAVRQHDALSAIEQALAGLARAERGVDLLTLKSELLLRRGDCAGFLTAKRAALDAGAKVERLPLGAACEQPAPSGSLQ